MDTRLTSANVALWRNADYQWTRLFAHIAIALVVTLTFLQLNDSLVNLQYRVFAVFFATILPALVLAQIEPQYIMSRMTFNVGDSSKSRCLLVWPRRPSASVSHLSTYCTVNNALTNSEKPVPRCTRRPSSPSLRCSPRCRIRSFALRLSSCCSTSVSGSPRPLHELDTSSSW